jgi:hypothetical protein
MELADESLRDKIVEGQFRAISVREKLNIMEQCY